MDAVTEQEPQAITMNQLWKAIKQASRKHRAAGLVPVLLTMHPRDLAELRIIDRQNSLVQFDPYSGRWTAFGVPISERPMPGHPERAIAMQRPRWPTPGLPADWRTRTVQQMDQLEVEAF